MLLPGRPAMLTRRHQGACEREFQTPSNNIYLPTMVHAKERYLATRASPRLFTCQITTW
jgi:hypothetical protein